MGSSSIQSDIAFLCDDKVNVVAPLFITDALPFRGSLYRSILLGGAFCFIIFSRCGLYRGGGEGTCGGGGWFVKLWQLAGGFGIGRSTGWIFNLLPNLVNHLPLSAHHAAIDAVDNNFNTTTVTGAHSDALFAGPTGSIADFSNAFKNLVVIGQNLHP